MKKGPNYELDLEKYRDPMRSRAVYEALAEVHSSHPRTNLERIASAVESMPVLIPRDHPYAEEIQATFALLEELLTGKGLEIDRASGEPTSADLMTEVSDFFANLASGKNVKQYREASDGEDSP